MNYEINDKLYFVSDYMEGAHPLILENLAKTNLYKTPGYGTDSFCESARQKIREACEAPEADVYFLVGGTQTNATVIDSILRQYQGVIAADTGHINAHEAGAIEFTGRKVLTLPSCLGKISAHDIEKAILGYKEDDNRDHMIMPGMVYISQPTEYGTLYTYNELEEISNICHKNGLSLYLDGARLAYALGCPENDVTLKDISRLCDAFYIGGTKCGTLFGEAVVIPKKDYIPHFFTLIKQHGALLAKGRLLGIQFDTLFTDDLYYDIGKDAIKFANKIKNALIEKGYKLYLDNPTNQIFVILENTKMQKLSEKVEFSFWEKYDETHTVIRFVTNWATKEEDVNALINIL